MDVMIDDEARPQAMEVLAALDRAGATMGLTLKPTEGFFLLSALQVALAHPMVDLPLAVEPFARRLAEDIERRLGNGRPAVAEAAKAGWEVWHEMRKEEPIIIQKNEPEAAAHGDAAAESYEDRRKDLEVAAPPKQKPERTPENKAIEPPENKKGKRKRP